MKVIHNSIEMHSELGQSRNYGAAERVFAPNDLFALTITVLKYNARGRVHPFLTQAAHVLPVLFAVAKLGSSDLLVCSSRKSLLLHTLSLGPPGGPTLCMQELPLETFQLGNHSGLISTI